MRDKDTKLLEEAYTKLLEDKQLEFELGDTRSKPKEIPPVDPLDDTSLVEKIKAMLKEYSKTKDRTLLREIMEELSKMYASEAKILVKRFENDPLKTTRGNYGKYMQVLSSLKGIHRGAMVFALRDAGAGRGLEDALRIVGG